MEHSNTAPTMWRGPQTLCRDLREEPGSLLRLQLPVSLLGVRSSGEPLSEVTGTEFVSGCGAVVESSHGLSAQQEIVLSYGTKKILGRVVGETGLTARGHGYGISFLQPDPFFWGVSFGHSTNSIAPAWLECCGCGEISEGNLNDIEALVLHAHRRLLLLCLNCNGITFQKPAEVDIPVTEKLEIERSTSDEKTPAGRDNETYAKDPNLVSIASVQDHEFYRPARKLERRRSKRLSLSKAKACIERSGAGPDLSIVENVSRGGACVRSARRYALGDWIRIACPYTIGGTNIFQPARIVRVVPGKLYCEYGIEYVSTV
jgi:PilZ domain